MRDYQNHGKYHLPPLLYKRIINLTRDYEKRLKIEYAFLKKKEILSEDEKCRLDILEMQKNAIEKAYLAIPDEYRDGVKGKIIFDRYPEFMSDSTFGRYKSLFVWNVAKNMHEI